MRQPQSASDVASRATLSCPPITSGRGIDSTLARVITDLAIEHSDQLYTEVDLYGRETSASMASLYERACRLVPALRAAAPADTATVVICVESVLDYVPAAWACIIAGQTFMPWNFRTISAHDEQIKSKISFIASKLGQPVLITTPSVGERLESIAPGAFGERVLVEQPAKFDDAGPDLGNLTGPTGEHAAILVQTSGSSGVPKLVEISFKRVLHRWMQEFNDSHGDQYLALQPFDTSFASTFQLFAKPQGLVYLPLERAFADPQNVLRMVEKQRVRHLGSSNSFFAKLLQTLDDTPFEGDLSHLRSLRLSGEMASLDLALSARDRLHDCGARNLEIRFMYGSSELGHISMLSDRQLPEHPARGDSRAVSQGHVRPGNELRVVDADDGLLGRDDIGRIQVRTDFQMFTGYFADPVATAKAFTSDGWFKTGDLGFVDDLGVTVIGRESGMIITNGRNISLSQIDACLQDLPGIKQQLVASAPVRTATSVTDELAVFFVPAKRAVGPDTARAIKRRVAETFGTAVTHLIELAEEDFARTPTGKIDRKVLVAAYEAGALQAVLTTTVNPPPASHASDVPATLVSQCWHRVLGIESDSTTAAADFFDLGGDSLKFAELVVVVEDELGCEIPIQRFFENPTLSTLVLLLDETRARAAASPFGSPNSVSSHQVVRRLEAMLGTWTGDRLHAESLIVGANTSGSRTPIVWICQSNGEFVALAEAVGSDQPIYGLRSLDKLVANDQLTSETLDAISYRYLAEILSLRLDPRLVIGGNCSGAIVALALARKAPHLGLEPSSLVLLNWMFSFGRYEGPVVLLQGSDGTGPFALHDWEGRPIDWQSDFPAADPRVIPGAHGKYFEGANLAALAAEIQSMTGEMGEAGGSSKQVTDWLLRRKSEAQHAISRVRQVTRVFTSGSRGR